MQSIKNKNGGINQMEWDSLLEILRVIWPLIAINVAIQVYAIIDVHKKDRRVVLLSKTWWTVVLIFINVAWVVYFLGGRET